MRSLPWILAAMAVVLALPDCGQAQGSLSGAWNRTGRVDDVQLDEISGIQASQLNPGAYFVHNDDSDTAIHVIDQMGHDLGEVRVPDAVNRDWEDIAGMPGPDGPVVVLGDIGDNQAVRTSLTLYLIKEPDAHPDGHYSGTATLLRKVILHYPDGPRDAESLAWDPLGRQLLLLSKRDHPPRLYAVPGEALWAHDEFTLKFIEEVDEFRPPTREDLARLGKRGQWVSQPTGMDISTDGCTAAVLTYRSVYLFRLGTATDWSMALHEPAREIIGPAAMQNEAVGFGARGHDLLVTGEAEHASVFRTAVPDGNCQGRKP